MRLFYATLMAAVLFCFSTSAYAKDPRIKFYNFDEMLIDGEIKKPKGLLTDVHRKAEFKRLNHLSKSFMKELEDTAKEKAFK